MALSTGAKIFLGVATFGIGLVIYNALSEDKSKKKKGDKVYEGGITKTPPPGPFKPTKVTRDEPEEGWAARWEARKDVAIAECRKDADVSTYAEAQACILSHVFPEAHPWGGDDVGEWQTWMQTARQAVRDEIRDLTVLAVGGWGAPGWQFPIWLMFDREFPICQEESDGTVDGVTLCLATKMFPDYTWPPSPEFPGHWANTFWPVLRERVANRLQGAGVGDLAG